jgi:hypothetical protein
LASLLRGARIAQIERDILRVFEDLPIEIGQVLRICHANRQRRYARGQKQGAAKAVDLPLERHLSVPATPCPF